MELGRLAELIETLEEYGEGVTIRPIREGMPVGVGSGAEVEALYEGDGWEVGTITGFGESELAAGPTLAAAVEKALAVVRASDIRA